jgi:hypothetical protein
VSSVVGTKSTFVWKMTEKILAYQMISNCKMVVMADGLAALGDIPGLP